MKIYDIYKKKSEIYIFHVARMEKETEIRRKRGKARGFPIYPISPYMGEHYLFSEGGGGGVPYWFLKNIMETETDSRWSYISHLHIWKLHTSYSKIFHFLVALLPFSIQSYSVN